MTEQDHMSDEGSDISEKVEEAINTDALQNIPVNISIIINV